uniref:Uncharacterized protein n=1 Tax=Timema monikensis TaxID=170555 RepID=A0A7R9E620_9NEOP|nr:unnamed protein product [Timema monikensis]
MSSCYEPLLKKRVKSRTNVIEYLSYRSSPRKPQRTEHHQTPHPSAPLPDHHGSHNVPNSNPGLNTGSHPSSGGSGQPNSNVGWNTGSHPNPGGVGHGSSPNVGWNVPNSGGNNHMPSPNNNNPNVGWNVPNQGGIGHMPNPGQPSPGWNTGGSNHVPNPNPVGGGHYPNANTGSHQYPNQNSGSQYSNQNTGVGHYPNQNTGSHQYPNQNSGNQYPNQNNFGGAGHYPNQNPGGNGYNPNYPVGGNSYYPSPNTGGYHYIPSPHSGGTYYMPNQQGMGYGGYQNQNQNSRFGVGVGTGLLAGLGVAGAVALLSNHLHSNNNNNYMGNHNYMGNNNYQGNNNRGFYTVQTMENSTGSTLNIVPVGYNQNTTGGSNSSGLVKPTACQQFFTSSDVNILLGCHSDSTYGCVNTTFLGCQPNSTNCLNIVSIGCQTNATTGTWNVIPFIQNTTSGLNITTFGHDSKNIGLNVTTIGCKQNSSICTNIISIGYYYNATTSNLQHVSYDCPQNLTVDAIHNTSIGCHQNSTPECLNATSNTCNSTVGCLDISTNPCPQNSPSDCFNVTSVKFKADTILGCTKNVSLGCQKDTSSICLNILSIECQQDATDGCSQLYSQSWNNNNNDNNVNGPESSVPQLLTQHRKRARRAPLSTTISNRLTASWRPTTSVPRPSRSFGKIPLSLLEAPGRSPFPSYAPIHHVGSANYIFACLLEEWQNTSGDDWETSTTLTGHAFTSGLRNLHNLHRTCCQGKWVPWTEGSRRANLIQGLDLSSKLQASPILGTKRCSFSARRDFAARYTPSCAITLDSPTSALAIEISQTVLVDGACCGRFLDYASNESTGGPQRWGAPKREKHQLFD